MANVNSSIRFWSPHLCFSRIIYRRMCTAKWIRLIYNSISIQWYSAVFWSFLSFRRNLFHIERNNMESYVTTNDSDICIIGHSVWHVNGFPKNTVFSPIRSHWTFRFMALKWYYRISSVELVSLSTQADEIIRLSCMKKKTEKFFWGRERRSLRNALITFQANSLSLNFIVCIQWPNSIETSDELASLDHLWADKGGSC